MRLIPEEEDDETLELAPDAAIAVDAADLTPVQEAGSTDGEDGIAPADSPWEEPGPSSGSGIQLGGIWVPVEGVSRSALIPTENIPLEDDHQFNLAGHKLWAERGIQILQDRGWAPWAHP